MKKGLVVVAHPDDEIIWMGGTILKNRNWDWTIISLCRKNDSDRRPKFEKVCRRLGAKCTISDLDDEKLNPLNVKDVANKVEDLLREKEFDYVYTHGLNGEYGHIRHREVHKAVKKLVRQGRIKCKKLYSFSYSLGEKFAGNVPNLKIPVPGEGSDLYVRLNEDNFKKKVSFVRDMYGFGGDSFEVLACNNVEAFREL